MRILTCLTALAAVIPAAAEEGSLIGRKIDDFTLTDPRSGESVALADYRNGQPVAVVFLGTECPINNLYLPRLNQLSRRHAFWTGVRFLGVNSNVTDSAKEIAAHAEEHSVAFPVLSDPDGTVARMFGATMTPEAFVLDADGVVRYRGRIDNQFGYLFRKLDPTEETFKEAIDAVVAGRPVRVPETEIAGCVIARRPEAEPDATITYTKHIASLMQKHCQECHREGQLGPMSLMNYQDVADWSLSIHGAVGQERMPPWYADPNIGEFANDRHMPPAEREMLLKWIDQGCPEGDPEDMPPPREFLSDDEWRIGKPDLILEMPIVYEVPAKTPRGGIPYQYFVVDPGFTEDMWVQRAEAKAGATTVVHHIIGFVAPPKDQIVPGEYPEFPLLPGVKNARVLCGTAPGDLPSIHPEGSAARIPAGSKIVFQMHYTPNGKAETDRSKIGIVFAKGKPEKELITVPVFNPKVEIPPGDPNHEMQSRFVFEDDAEILSMMPHMHLRGKDFRYDVISPDGKETTLLWVPKYNFNWQNMYRLKEPIRVRKGDVMRCTAHYDNSADNPNNPDPTRTVRWGDQTWQEMLIGWMDIVYDRPVR